jgi:predicted RNA-binding Zn-ribbon protein involved in translation (DUF1610 family)
VNARRLLLLYGSDVGTASFGTYVPQAGAFQFSVAYCCPSCGEAGWGRRLFIPEGPSVAHKWIFEERLCPSCGGGRLTTERDLELAADPYFADLFDQPYLERILDDGLTEYSFGGTRRSHPSSQ